MPSKCNFARESALKMKFCEQKCPFSSSSTMPYFNPGQNTGYAIPPSSKNPLIRACLLLAFTEASQHPALSTLSQTSLANYCVSVFRNPLTNRHQLLQPVNLSLHCPHSLCNAVDRQHSPRKPRRGTGRLATTPDTKLFFTQSHTCLH